NRLHLRIRLVLRKAPTVDVEILRIVTRNRLHLARETAYPPHKFSISNRIRRKLKRLRNHDLLWAVFWFIDDRRRVAGDHDWTLDFPTYFAGVLVDRDEIRRRMVLID